MGGASRGAGVGGGGRRKRTKREVGGSSSSTHLLSLLSAHELLPHQSGLGFLFPLGGLHFFRFFSEVFRFRIEFPPQIQLFAHSMHLIVFDRRTHGILWGREGGELEERTMRESPSLGSVIVVPLMCTPIISFTVDGNRSFPLMPLMFR